MSPHEGLVGRSEALRRLRRAIAAVAPASTTVLLTGETGVGKGVVAREIHRRSERCARRLVHVDCAALAPSVIESELFGHERGAFTGAAGARAGRFELAAGSTIFLDEIGELALALQSKLLRVLQDREFERLGGTATRPMTARVIAASNRDLRAAVDAGRFRADLLFRLDVFRIRVPPLRERPEDLPDLVAAGVRELRERLGPRVPSFEASFHERLASHSWPGNVRELLNLLERLALLHGDARLDGSALDGLLDETPGDPRPALARDRVRWRRTDDAAERARIAEALARERGNVSRAARRLGLSRSTLRYRIRRYEL